MKTTNIIIYILTIITVIFLLPAVSKAQQIMTDYTGPVFPSNHALNTPIDSLPVHLNSSNYIASVGTNTALHPDFGTSWDDGGTVRPMGIPYNVVGASQPFVQIIYDLYGDESDPGPWPIQQNPYVETVFDWRDPTAGDRHMLIVDSSSHILYETGNVYKGADSIWHGGCGAVFDLNSNNLRTETWTSADAAGLPIFPLLIRYDEVERARVSGGEIPHAIRFTVQNSQQAYVWPARHYASSSTDTNHSPMGLRFRLKASVDISGFSSRMQVILRTLKKYGFIVSDNGSDWFFQGTHDDRWDDDELSTLKNLHGRDFEAVDISSWMNRPGFDLNSGAVPSPSGTSLPLSSTSNVPISISLYQNYPNPFNPTTKINFTLAKASDVKLTVFNVLGQKVATLIDNRRMNAGLQSAMFDASKLTSGVYFYRLETGSFTASKKMIILK